MENLGEGLLLSTALAGSLIFLVAGIPARAEVVCEANQSTVNCTDVGFPGYITANSFGQPGGGAGYAATATVSGDNSAGAAAASSGGVGSSGEESGDVFGDATAGGNGGQAGAATVTVNAGATITVDMDSVSGAAAWANGGNGGVGGEGRGIHDSASGGNGGTGGTAMVTNNGSVTINGNIGAGLLATANGGAGGLPGTVSLREAGDGGAGGNGGTAQATNAAGASIVTTGQYDAGIYIQANGGNGAQIPANGDYKDAAGSGLGGTGGRATAINSGSITTSGASSSGIYVEAIGGENGYYDVNLGKAIGDIVTSYGRGGSVVVENSGSVKTSGAASHGIVATTNGGSINYASQDGSVITVSGENAKGIVLDASGNNSDARVSTFSGGDISAQITGTVSTSGASTFSTAEDTGNLSRVESPNTSAAININSSGGDADGPDWSDGFVGGDAGNVKVVTQADVTVSTAGDDSDAISIRSSGGDGSDGNQNGTEDGGNGGTAGAVSVNILNGDTITTKGARSRGLYIMSAGGNGGSGADTTLESAGNGGTGGSANVTLPDLPYAVSVTNNASIATQGDSAAAIDVNSLGGSGGNGGHTDDSLFADAGAPGSSGSGGAIQVINSGSLSTAGGQSYGLFANSVGGGGGNGGSANLSLGVFSIGLGVDASGGGIGNTVDLANSGSITTTGDSGAGIFGLSVGGGGGNGGTVGATAIGLPSISVALGGNGGEGGHGGLVTIDNSGSVETSGFDATAIRALSVGGGGGNGGGASATSYSAGYKAIPAISVALAIGGSGGAGGNGGAVTVTNEGDLTATGDQAYGILAMSAGGGGGNGGNATTQTYTYGAATVGVQIGVALGGTGGEGGLGGTVNVTNSKTIDTAGFAADGIYAISVGGGGGKGGIGTSRAAASLPTSTIASDIPLNFGNTYDLELGIGGAGGQGNHGGVVEVSNSGTIQTSGLDSRGILAQSIGGGGGSAGAGQSSGAGTVTLNISVGGSGGAGGNGDAVTVKNETGAAIVTTADGSHGIEAQSIGGGGGSGGSASADRSGNQTVTTAWLATKNMLKQKLSSILEKKGIKGMFKPDWFPSIAFDASVGGSGGAAGDGGEVQIANDGSVKTKGDVAFGLFGQSVGGGGGNAGGATVAGGAVENFNVSAGGAAGAAGSGKKVILTNNETIVTAGDSSFAMFGQSIGGGGGVSGAALDTSTTGIVPFLNLGANRSTSAAMVAAEPVEGAGGLVEMTNTGTITTQGSEAHGIVAQSIGGGGGLIFVNQAEAVLTTPVQQDADIQDLYSQIDAALRQDGVDIDAIATEYQAALDNASGTVTLALGGVHNENAAGGEVTMRQSGAVSTSGNNAFGVVAQSIGGGGGLVTDGGGTNLALSLDNSATDTPIFGGGNGDGGDVTVQLDSGSTISTTGTGSVGVFAQSIGGGGGFTGALDVADMAFTAADPNHGESYYFDVLSTKIIANGLAGFAGAGGLVTINGGDDDTAGFSIETTGQNAHGVFAQSISYGGGMVADENGIILPQPGTVIADTTDWLPLDCAADNACDTGVVIDLAGTINTSGAGSAGIFAQSGIQTAANGETLNGSITKGLGSIAVTYSGTLTGGSGNGAGIWIDGGTNNTIQLNGASVSSLSGTAIRSTIGSETVTFDAASTVTGNVVLDSNRSGEVNRLTNNGMFSPSSLVALGGTGVQGLAGPSTTPSYLGGSFTGYVSQGLLVNNGTINAGGAGTVSSVEIYGDVQQTVSGTIAVDVDPGTVVQSPLTGANGSLNWVASDYLQIEGSAQIGGSVTPSLVGRPQAANDGTFEAAFLGAEVISAQTADGKIVPVVSTPVVSYTLAQQQAATPIYTLSGTADFSAAATAAANNLQEIAAQLQVDWLNGQADSEHPNYTDMLVSVANTPDQAGYQSALSNLEGGGHAVQVAATANRSKSYSDTLYSCPVFVGSSALLSEESCVYSRMIYDSFDYNDEGNQATGYEQSGYTMLFGGQKALEDNWYLGGSFAIGHADLDGDDNRFSGNEDTYQFGAVVKKRIGSSWMIGASAYYGYFDGDMTRSVVMPDGSTQFAVSSPTTQTFGARARASYDIDLGQSYLRPLMDFDAIFTHTPGYGERGASGLNLSFDSTDDWTFGLTPGIEIGARLPFEGGIARPFASAAMTQWFDNDLTMTTRIDGSAGSGFNTTYEMGDTIGRISAGVEFVMDNGLELRGQYDGAFSKDSSSNSGTIRLGWRF